MCYNINKLTYLPKTSFLQLLLCSLGEFPKHLKTTFWKVSGWVLVQVYYTTFAC